jgi:hypothetical protein
VCWCGCAPDVTATTTPRTTTPPTPHHHPPPSLHQAQHKTEALAAAISQQELQQIQRERKVQAICESDPALRELQSKIQLAYANKERAEQIRRRQLDEEAAAREAARLAERNEQEQQRRDEEARQREAQRQAMADHQKSLIAKQLHDRKAQVRVCGARWVGLCG